MDMIDVGGYRLATTRERGNAPPVVFVAALGTTMDSWDPVLDRLTCDSEWMRYDRAALGASEPRPQRHGTYALFADELARLLDRLDLREPAVFVGHSIGSPIVRMFADAYPHLVDGAVHVDPTVPEFLPDLDIENRRDGAGPAATMIDLRDAAREIKATEFPTVPVITLCGTSTCATLHPGDAELAERCERGRSHLTEITHATRIDAVDAPDTLRAPHVLYHAAPALVAHAVDRVVAAVRDGLVRPDLDPAEVRALGGQLAA